MQLLTAARASRPPCRALTALTVFLMLLACGVASAQADDAAAETPEAEGPVALSDPLGVVEVDEDEALDLSDATMSADERKDQYWYLIVGVANVWPRLEESSAEIDRDINGLFRPLLPRWNEPTTFADWRDWGKLWDVHLGIGRSLSDKWSVFATFGGIAGTVRTRNDYYPLGIPAEVYTKFERKVWFVSAGVDYYPWGKASLDKATKGNHWITKRLFASRPYLEAGAGYVNVYTVGQVKVSVPLLDDIAKVKHAEYYDLFYLSPRIGLDVPLTDRTTLALMGGYLFFLQHPDEYSSQSYYILFKHRL